MPTDTLYEEDFVTWTERQAKALRDARQQGANLPLDWDNLAEEIEDLGKSVRNKVASLTYQILRHLLKIACSGATEQRIHWKLEVDEFRGQLARLLDDNPALSGRLDDVVEHEFRRAARSVSRELSSYGEEPARPLLTEWDRRRISASEVAQDGLYPDPGTLTFTKSD